MLIIFSKSWPRATSAARAAARMDSRRRERRRSLMVASTSTSIAWAHGFHAGELEKMEVPQGTSDVDSNQDGNAEPFDGFPRFGTQDFPCSVDTALTVGIVVVSNPRGVKSIPTLIGLVHAR